MVVVSFVKNAPVAVVFLFLFIGTFSNEWVNNTVPSSLSAFMVMPTDSSSAVKKHQETLCVLAARYHGKVYVHVLRRYYCIHGKSGEDM